MKIEVKKVLALTPILIVVSMCATCVLIVWIPFSLVLNIFELFKPKVKVKTGKTWADEMAEVRKRLTAKETANAKLN